MHRYASWASSSGLLASNNGAFGIAGETDPGSFAAEHFVQLANSLGIGPRYLLKLGREMATAVEAAVPAAAAEVLPLLTPGQREMAERIVHEVGSITRLLAARLDLGAA